MILYRIFVRSFRMTHLDVSSYNLVRSYTMVFPVTYDVTAGEYCIHDSRLIYEDYSVDGHKFFQWSWTDRSPQQLFSLNSHIYVRFPRDKGKFIGFFVRKGDIIK